MKGLVVFCLTLALACALSSLSVAAQIVRRSTNSIASANGQVGPSSGSGIILGARRGRLGRSIRFGGRPLSHHGGHGGLGSGFSGGSATSSASAQSSASAHGGGFGGASAGASASASAKAAVLG